MEFIRPFGIVIVLAVLSRVRADESRIDPRVDEEKCLWLSDPVNTYRIPLLTFTTHGSLLAFSEARKNSSDDIAAKSVALRRSIDRGATWSPTSFILDDGVEKDGLNLGSVVVDEDTGAVMLIYSACFHHFKCSPSSTMMVQSLDDGLTWSPPQNLSVDLGVKSFAPGPGYGIQKRHPPNVGRLVVCGHSSIDDDGVFLILSDDHGKSWRYGAALKSIPYKQPKKDLDFIPDECQPVELEDGIIVIHIRNQNNYHCRCRIIARSLDGGESLPVEEVTFHEALIDPAVAAGALQKREVMYFTNPSSTYDRVNLTLRWSFSGGVSWENETLQIWDKSSGYSTMTAFKGNSSEDNKYIFILFEKGCINYWEIICFVKIHLYGGKTV